MNKHLCLTALGILVACLLSWTGYSVIADNKIAAPVPSSFSNPLAPIADGLYTIKGDQSGRCLDIKRDNPNSGRLQIYGCGEAANNQKFYLSYDSAVGGYAMRIEDSNKCVDVYGNGGGNGNIIHEFDCNNQRNQRWKVVPLGSGYEIRPMQVDNKCMDVANQSVGDKSEVHQWDCNNQLNQRWYFRNTTHYPPPTPTPITITASGATLEVIIPDGLYYIRGRQSDRCLDIRLDGNDRGRLQIFGCGPEHNNQKFRLSRDSAAGGYEMRLTESSGECLDVFDKETHDGKRIQQYTCKSSDVLNQRWQVIAAGNGWYQIRPMHVAGKCIDVAYQSVGDRSEVNQFACNGQANQQWKFETAPPAVPPTTQDPPHPVPDPSPETQLIYGGGTCTDIPQFGYKGCPLTVRNINKNKDIVADFYWSGSGIPPGPFVNTPVPPFQHITVGKDSVWDVHSSALFPIATNVALEFHVVKAAYK